MFKIMFRISKIFKSIWFKYLVNKVVALLERPMDIPMVFASQYVGFNLKNNLCYTTSDHHTNN